MALLAQVVYSEFLDLVNTGNVRQARIDESLQKVYFSVRPLQQAGQQDAPAEASTSGNDAGHARCLHKSFIDMQGFSLCSKGVTLDMHMRADFIYMYCLNMHYPQETYFESCSECPDALQACQQRGRLFCSGCRRTRPRTL